MTLSILFWFLMILWFIFGGMWWYQPDVPHWRGPTALLAFVLFGILGWAVFGAAIR